MCWECGLSLTKGEGRSNSTLRRSTLLPLVTLTVNVAAAKKNWCQSGEDMNGIRAGFLIGENFVAGDFFPHSAVSC